MNPLDFLFSETEFHTKTSFKYVLDHTFFRPRDLILFFQPISDYAYQIPLSFYETNHLLGDFVVALFKELRNELGCQFSNDELNRLFIFFRSLNLSKHMDYNEFYDQIDCIGLKKQTKDVMNILFDYSLIGNCERTNGSDKYTFKYRHKEYSNCELNEKQSIAFHYSLRVYCNLNGSITI
jgi:hypothetical protein